MWLYVAAAGEVMLLLLLGVKNGDGEFEGEPPVLLELPP
jgi:hypothetical protein